MRSLGILFLALLLQMPAWGGEPVPEPDVLEQILHEVFHDLPTNTEGLHTKNASRFSTVGGPLFSVGILGMLTGLSGISGHYMHRRMLPKHFWSVSATGLVTAPAMITGGVLLLKKADDEKKQIPIVKTRQEAIQAIEAHPFYPQLKALAGPKIDELVYDLYSGWTVNQVLKKYVTDADEYNHVQKVLKKARNEVVTDLGSILGTHSSRIHSRELMERLALEQAFFESYADQKSASYRSKVSAALRKRRLEIKAALEKETAKNAEIGYAESEKTSHPVAPPSH